MYMDSSVRIFNIMDSHVKFPNVYRFLCEDSQSLWIRL